MPSRAVPAGRRGDVCAAWCSARFDDVDGGGGQHGAVQAGRRSRVRRGSATGATGGDDWCDDVWCMVAQGELHYGAQGHEAELSAEDGTTIWYTTNDTCPCRDEGRVKYTEPIALDSNMYVRIAAQRPGMSYSEYSERLNISITVTDEAAPEPTPIQTDSWRRRAGRRYGWLWWRRDPCGQFDFDDDHGDDGQVQRARTARSPAARSSPARVTPSR